MLHCILTNLNLKQQQQQQKPCNIMVQNTGQNKHLQEQENKTGYKNYNVYARILKPTETNMNYKKKIHYTFGGLSARSNFDFRVFISSISNSIRVT